MKVLTAEAMREVDRFAIEELGIPGLILMEHAALGVADAIGQRYPDACSAAIFCGPGNNGGDGLAVARLLHGRGYELKIFLAPGSKPATGDAAIQREICERLGLGWTRIGDDAEVAEMAAAAAALDLTVDSLFGTGLGRPLEGRLGELASALAGLDCPVVAVDLPSGLSGSRSDVFGPHVVADLTVTFGAPKIAHLFPPAAEAVGDVVVADLGIPQRLFEHAAGDLRLTSAREVGLLLQPREASGHKGTYGHTLVVGGSKGKSGAALLAARAAIRAGSGLVSVAVPENLLDVLEAQSLESMTVGLPIDAGEGLAAAALDVLLEAASGKRAVAIGPGLGSAATTAEVIRSLVLRCEAPLVLDADGLNAFAGRVEELRERHAPLILTPHPGELARLLQCDRHEIAADRPAAVRQAVERTGAVVVLKGHLSLVADVDGIAINPTGNPGMASGGTGDVLTGLIAGLLAQGREPVEAAELGVFAHGLAGDLAAEEVGELSLSAGDLLDRLPDAFEALRSG